MAELTYKQYPFLKDLGIQEDNFGSFIDGKWIGGGEVMYSSSPIDNKPIARIRQSTLEEYEQGIQSMLKAKKQWSETPIPLRGEIVRQIGDAFRAKREQLGLLVSVEMGKIKTEGLGEIQEIIDICDMACGLSRGLYGLVIPSERPNHFMMEQWNPLGLVGIITAFNFPAAVFGWNMALGLVCGNLLCWKGAPSTNLVTIACTNIIADVLRKNNLPTSIIFTLNGDVDQGIKLGEAMVNDHRMSLISFTGSTKVGKMIAQKVASRLGKVLLELGGNNAQIVMQDANLELAIKAAVFSAVGTAGQRCTTLRRLILHKDIADTVIQRMVKAYSTVKVGNPLEEGTLCGPLHTKQQIDQYKQGLERIQQQGGKILFGGKVFDDIAGNYVVPTLVEISKDAPIIKEELFVPILYIVRFSTFEEAVEINNNVPQGLSSTLFTQDLSNAYRWTGPNGSDCGIVNVNIGTSGAEIGGAFGGEKETGGGRESGSDSWKQYMRRSTCTINFGKTLPLAQGVVFDI